MVPDALGTLRVLDAGTVSPLRSQSLWHAVTDATRPGGDPTLVFVRPAKPYVCLGFHRPATELDSDYCAKRGWQVLRRMAGGGPVYLDGGQLFFCLVLPLDRVPVQRSRAFDLLLRPAVEAFRAVGVFARQDDDGEICVADSKICGHGAAQIGEAVVLCGNLIESFDHDRASRILALPGPTVRREVRRMMTRYVVATPVDAARFRDALIGAVASKLALRPRKVALTRAERATVVRWDARFTDPGWLAGARPRAGQETRVKVKNGVWVSHVAERGAELLVSAASGRVVRASARRAGAGFVRLDDHAGCSLGQFAAALARTADPALARLAARIDGVTVQSAHGGVA